MTSRRGEMHLALFLLGTGNHPAGWRLPQAGRSNLDLPLLLRAAQLAERSLFDMIFVADGLALSLTDHPSYVARFEPLTLLATLGAHTTQIGLGATVSTTYGEPYHVARAFSSLDHLTGGRAAWNVVTTANPAVAANFSRLDHPEPATRYEIAGEFVDVVRGLWDGWEDDALVADRESGLFADSARIHPLNHSGQYFSVRGPLSMPRSPQGQPIIIQAGGSPAGRALAARTADVVFAAVQDFDAAKLSYRDLKSQLASFGRDPASLKVLPGVMPIIGRSKSEALATLDRLQSFLTPTNALHLVSIRLGHDISQYSLDGPVPDLPFTAGTQGFAKGLLEKARQENMTLRDLYNLTAAARGHWVLCGTATEVADTLEQWFVEEAADGFNILPPFFPDAFDDFVQQVVPELQRRGLFRQSYGGNTLRSHLGLSRPLNQFAAK
ncbi:LLM class flavin-dependent oxidoreductase [Bradyrhizobium sp. Arg237L]|uniref:LLM class flavin-dependent oxidoreductase n=1 Tax=Bradyrhizobium sp. Arg237L TaxID=3003352 RepID=UPI00249E534A|nr:LLM class flavin-dependent oxidoreductase [Bradyrhizobium sp. Arg237L]MDI4238300.1 LLM class flavin-dependent oxidoreductase [Bradyrhizobium sp. Arg237L]